MRSSLWPRREFPGAICPSASATGTTSFNASTARAHQHSAGQKNSTPEQEQLGRWRGGVSTKIHVAVDGLGKPTQLILSAGQAHDVTKASDLIRGSQADKVIADKAYDSDALMAQ